MNIGIVNRKVASMAAAAALAVLGAGAAQAAYIVNTAGIDSSVGSLNGTVNFAPSGLSENAAIGRLDLGGTVSTTGASFNWASYCVDIFDQLAPGTFNGASVAALNLSAVRLSDLNALVSNVGAYVTNATTSAAAQMAVWEIVNETSSSLDVSNGAFSVTNISGDAVTDANKMLSAVSSGAWKASDSFNMALLKGSNNQTQLVYGSNTAGVAAVPEPGSWMMMLAGFGAIGLATRRRRTTVAFDGLA